MWKKLLINGLIICWAIGAGVFVSLKPWQVYQKQNDEARAHERLMHDAEHRRDDLLRQEGRYESYSGHEELARKGGFVHGNEVVLDTNKK